MTLRERRCAAWLNLFEPRRLTIALLTLSLLGVTAQARALETTPLEITLDPTRFTGQTVTVHGTLTNLLPHGQMRGPGAVFDVMERGAFVRVFSLTPPPCSPGSAVTVNGRFLTTQSSGGQTLTNVIEAFSVSCRRKVRRRRTGAAGRGSGLELSHASGYQARVRSQCRISRPDPGGLSWTALPSRLGTLGRERVVLDPSPALLL